jgi:hypothetical protein
MPRAWSLCESTAAGSLAAVPPGSWGEAVDGRCHDGCDPGRVGRWRWVTRGLACQGLRPLECESRATLCQRRPAEFTICGEGAAGVGIHHGRQGRRYSPGRRPGLSREANGWWPSSTRAATHSAIDDFCPHMGASLAGGYVENGKVACPWHAWRFCVKDGTWCDNPRIKIDAFEVRVEGDEIQVLVPEKKPPASPAA